MAPFDSLYNDLLVVCHCKYSCITYYFRVIKRWKMLWP